VILVDCQPLLSASIMDRTIQLEKKFTTESSSTENTIEVQSLQIIGRRRLYIYRYFYL
jgi:hypothetical protein